MEMSRGLVQLKQRELFEWLRSLDLTHFFEPFLQQGYGNLSIVAQIHESDLEIIGVRDIRQKIELLQAIRHLRLRIPNDRHSDSFRKGNELNYSLQVDDSGDYEDIEDCECGEPFYETLSPRRLIGAHGPNEKKRTNRTKELESSSEENPLRSSRTQLRDHQHLQRQQRILGLSSFGSELTSESSHLYGSPLPPLSSRRVESEDLDSSSGIEPDLVSHRKSYALRTCGSTNTASSSSTPDEPPLPGLSWWKGEDRVKSWYRGPPQRNSTGIGSTRRKNGSNSPNCCLDVSARPFTLSGPNPCVVPTVSGLLSSIESEEAKFSSSQGAWMKPFPGNPMAFNLHSREFDYEDCCSTRCEDMRKALSRTPTHHHQYLEHVIISNTNSPKTAPPIGYRDEERGIYTSPTKSKQIYTPGIYSPSSCLQDRDDIYDYAPPVQYNPSPNEKCSLSRSKGKSKSALSCGEGDEGSGSHFPSVRRIHRTNQSSPTYVNVKRNNGVSAGGNGPKVLSSPSSPSSQCSNGCRTLANLSKLSRRLGLGRLFRTLRIQGHTPIQVRRKSGSVLTKPRPTPNQIRATTQDHWEIHSPHHIFTSSDEKEPGTSYTTLSSLPSNERIIETINRLKYEELQKRKERIAQEHTMILKELTTSKSQQPPPKEKSSSVFYVSATVESENTGEKLGDQQLERKSHSSTTETSGGTPSVRTMGGNQSNPAGIQERDSRESWNEKSSSSRTSSSSNYHSESSPFQNSHDQEHGVEVTESNVSSFDSPGRDGSTRRSPTPNQIKNRETRQKNKDGDPGACLEVDSEELEPLPLSPTNNNGSSPAKALLTKVMELGVRNQKKLRRFSFSSKGAQSHHITSEPRRGSEVTLSCSKRKTPSVDILENGDLAERNSSEEELSSLTNHQRSLSISEAEEYNGPFVGRAIALVDCISSPYDLHALSYKKGDILEIIEKKPTGNWKGKLQNRVGYFKFINVQILPENSEDGDEVEWRESCPTPSTDLATFPYSSSNNSNNGRRRTKTTSPLTPWDLETRQVVANVINGIRKENAALLQSQKDHRPTEDHSQTLDLESSLSQSGSYQKRGKSGGRRKSSSTSLKKGRPRSVGDLLRRINLEEHISVFILHGFDSLDLFKELEEEDLDRLAICKPEDRGKILTAVELLRDYDASGEIPPIIIPTYSCSNLDEGEELNQILEPPPNFTRGAAGTVVRDSGVFLKCDDKEEEDPESEEIILSPSNLAVTTLNAADKLLLSSRLNKNTKQLEEPLSAEGSEPITTSMAQFNSLEEHYGEVRQRFLHAKSLFESNTSGNGGGGSGIMSKAPVPDYKNQFLYCEKSSDSGISLGANSPPPTNF